MQCRSQCGACCIAPSINHPYYGMPNGKPANVACIHLAHEDMSCKIWNSPHYPKTCKNFAAEAAFCGETRAQALDIIAALEISTQSH
ncbi:MAG: hypothetical protein COA42_11310 [Alteromonadaceae bacterium]|nr:MAG: hypothetical protein COA42_11310 [Alteromonadaceae bacterium]